VAEAPYGFRLSLPMDELGAVLNSRAFQPCLRLTALVSSLPPLENDRSGQSFFPSFYICILGIFPLFRCRQKIIRYSKSKEIL
jgi:hypothetical protein